MSKGKEENKIPRYKVEGKIWFGNKYFLEEIAVSDEKENKAKEKFLKELKSRTEKLGSVEFENLNLLLNKYVPIIEAKIKTLEEDKREKAENEENKKEGKNKKEKAWFDLNGESIGGDSKKYFLEGIIKSFKIKYFRNYTDEIKENLKNQHYEVVICKPFTTKSRLVVGLGSSHVLETSLTLHHTYGIPYIPGSALKGVCRAVAFWKLAEKKGILNDEKKIKELSEKFYGKLVENDDDILTYQLLFGAQDFRGLLLFLDAYPIIDESMEIFELDIMNVHYRSYYGEGKAPGDWENPVPIYFLTVKPGVKFNICVLFDEFRWNRLKELEKFKNKNNVINKVGKLINGDFLEEILKIAISQFGVGAKGRLGYGILE